jgi:hypothetical protein
MHDLQAAPRTLRRAQAHMVSVRWQSLVQKDAGPAIERIRDDAVTFEKAVRSRGQIPVAGPPWKMGPLSCRRRDGGKSAISLYRPALVSHMAFRLCPCGACHTVSGARSPLCQPVFPSYLSAD